jgi:hypothetical protein
MKHGCQTQEEWVLDPRHLGLVKTSNTSYFFVFSEAKSVIVLHMEIEKT